MGLMIMMIMIEGVELCSANILKMFNNDDNNNNNNNNNDKNNENNNNNYNNNNNNNTKINKKEMTDTNTLESISNHLLQIFALTDTTKTGFLPVIEIEKILRSLHSRIPLFDLYSISSGLTLNKEGNIDYRLFTPICAQLLMVR